MPLRIRPSTESDLAAIRELFREYSDSLGIDLGFQHFEEELSALPGEYAPPTGALLLAEDGAPAGCVALRRFDDRSCEMKRLYVRPGSRHLGAGKALVDEIIAVAREASYERMRLDTLPSMDRALRLYRSLGFREIPPYRFNPVDGAVFLELEL